jgi:hypothetical protein
MGMRVQPLRDSSGNRSVDWPGSRAARKNCDPLATTFPDPDHSKEERREITIGYTMKGIWYSYRIASAEGGLDY